jgi:hypothetical protein
MIYLAVIGTAGRQKPVTLSQFNWAKKFVWDFVEEVRRNGETVEFVSGGAAASDHIAVDLFLNNPGKVGLYLALPCDIKNGRYVEQPGQYDPGRTSNYYHKNFSTLLYGKPFLTLGQVQTAKERCKFQAGGGFKNRNTDIATRSTQGVAFGHEPKLVDGGTKDTVTKMEKMGKEILYVQYPQ